MASNKVALFYLHMYYFVMALSHCLGSSHARCLITLPFLFERQHGVEPLSQFDQNCLSPACRMCPLRRASGQLCISSVPANACACYSLLDYFSDCNRKNINHGSKGGIRTRVVRVGIPTPCIQPLCHLTTAVLSLSIYGQPSILYCASIRIRSTPMQVISQHRYKGLVYPFVRLSTCRSTPTGKGG